jgi:hypothetical protein
VVRTLTDPSDLANQRWAPSSDAIVGILRPDGVPNVWRLPIDGRPATQITRFGPDEFSVPFIYTADGKLLFVRTSRLPVEVVQFTGWR